MKPLGTSRCAHHRLAVLFLFAATPAIAQTGTAIEFYHAEFGHYFVTADPAEADAIDAGVFKGWQRTGERFSVVATDAKEGQPVCRFFSASFAPKSSHFYTPIASECDAVKANPDWQYEDIAFKVALPVDSGACPSEPFPKGTVPLYRLYNDGQSGAPNHRYTTRWDLFLAMRSRFWTPEGDGSTFAFACVPPLQLTPITTAEGIWSGVTNIPNAVFIAAALENGDTWTLILTASEGVPAGFFRGPVASVAGTLAGQVHGYFFGQAVPAFATVTGVYSPREEVALTADGYGVTLTGRYAADPAYGQPTYDQPASALVAAGTWQVAGSRVLGPAVEGDLVVAVESDGTLSGSSPTGCQLSGTLAPRARASGKNVYDLAIVVDGADCPLGRSRSEGVVLLLAAPPEQSIALIGMSESSSPPNGFVWMGKRP